MLAIGLALVLAFAGVYALTIYAFSGGEDAWRASRQPTPSLTDSAIIGRRDAAVNVINADLDAVVKPLALTAGRSGASASCTEGQHNWKIKDDYAHSCSVWAGRFGGFSGDFPSFAAELDSALANAGWHNESEISSLVERYQDNVKRFKTGKTSRKQAELQALDALYGITFYRGQDYLDIGFVSSTKHSAYETSWMWLSEDVDSEVAVGELLKNDTVVMLIREHREFFRN